MTRTMAVGFGVLAPTLASFEPPVPYVLLLCVAILGFIASTMLPNAGRHLPKVEETEDKQVKIVEKGTKSATTAAIHNIDE